MSPPREPPSAPVLILGAGGFLGPHLVAAARAAGLAAVPASRRPGAGAPGLAVDLAEPGAPEGAIARVAPAIVVNAAALARGDACEREPGLARRLNAEVPGELARACAARGARLVHVSTDLVFGARGPRGRLLREEDEPDPASTYGATKAAGERAVLAADPSALVVRLPLLYGDSGGRGLGAGDALVAALARGETPRLFTDEWRTPLDAADAARALVELALGDASGRLHVAGPERVQRHELGLALLRAAGVEDAERRVVACTRAEAGMADRPEDVSLDATRARARLRTRLPGVPGRGR